MLEAVQGNRQLVLPLSGGYDSRSILAVLKRLNAKNVVCFSYGDKLNDEVEISRKLAESCGFPYYYVEYSKELCLSLESDRIKYENFAFNFTSLPHVQDFYAIHKLMSTGKIQVGDIVMPGHSADYSAGTHIPIKSFQKQSFTAKDLYKDLISFHLIGSGSKFVSASLKSSLSRFQGSLDFEKYRKEIELFDYKERQSKLTVNSIRIYDYFGLNAFLPLWDLKLKQQLMSIAGADRKNAEKYREWVIRFCVESGIPNLTRNREVREAYISIRNVFNYLKVIFVHKLYTSNILGNTFLMSYISNTFFKL